MARSEENYEILHVWQESPNDPLSIDILNHELIASSIGKSRY